MSIAEEILPNDNIERIRLERRLARLISQTSHERRNEMLTKLLAIKEIAEAHLYTDDGVPNREWIYVYGEILSAIGLTYKRLKIIAKGTGLENIKNALSYYIKRYENDKLLYDKEDYGRALGLNDVGVVLYWLFKFEPHKPEYLSKSERFLMESLRIREKHLPRKSQGVASALSSLSTLYVHKRDFNKALGYAQEVLNIRKQVYRNEDNEQIANGYQDVATAQYELYHETNNIEFLNSAHDNAKESVRIIQIVFPVDPGQHSYQDKIDLLTKIECALDQHKK